MPARVSATPQSRSRSSLELYAWFFTRMSGILLLLMGAFNLTYANLAGGYGNMDAAAQMRWAFFPISFHVQSSSVVVTPHFSNPFWQVYSLIAVVFAATHGFNGIRIILDDYVHHPMLLAWLRGLLVVLWLFGLLGAIFLIFVYAGRS